MHQRSIVILLISLLVGFLRSYALPTPIIDHTAYPTPCTPIFCFNQCPNGFVLDQNGCQTCDCNPCRFGQPLYNSPCGQGQNLCAANKGLCKVSTFDNAYCCPNERPGGCPATANPTVALCPRSKCNTDFDCSVGRKCCGWCKQCVNATVF